MTTMWAIDDSFESVQYFIALEQAEPPQFEFVNWLAVHKYRRCILDEYDGDDHDELELLEFNGMPMPVFKIADPAFKLDYFFHDKIRCASLRLRQALGLTDAVIRYRDIDLDQSPLATRKHEYQAFHVVAVGDPIDWNRTRGQFVELPRLDGFVRKIWILEPPDPVGPRQRIYWRDDFTPPAPLFRAFGTPWTMATGALADRVMRAGITDMVFKDVISDRGQTEYVLRQL
jgi:hypothetical protein